MRIGRRLFVSGLIAAPALGAARAAPVLSADNDGMTLARARRSNAWIEISQSGFETNLAKLRAAVGIRSLSLITSPSIPRA